MEYCNCINQIKSDIFKYVSILELSMSNMKYVNKDWYDYIQDELHRFKKRSLLNEEFLSRFDRSESRIKNMEFVFFNMKFMQTLFKDFKKYLFHISDNCKNKDREFFLMSKLYRMHYVKRISNNDILMVYVDSNNSTYYSFFEKKINLNEFPLSNYGYLNFRGKVNDKNYDSILELVNR